MPAPERPSPGLSDLAGAGPSYTGADLMGAVASGVELAAATRLKGLLLELWLSCCRR